MKTKNKKSDIGNIPKRPSDIIKFFRISAPIVIALTLFVSSAFYIIYRMISDYNYYERWKDYDECGLG